MTKYHDLHEPDGTIKRFCTKCKTIKNRETEFSHKRKLENGTFEYHTICRKCRLTYHRKRNLKNGHKPTLTMRRDTATKLFIINEKIKKLEKQKSMLLNNNFDPALTLKNDGKN